MNLPLSSKTLFLLIILSAVAIQQPSFTFANSPDTQGTSHWLVFQGNVGTPDYTSHGDKFNFINVVEGLEF